jgi:hypothetical protein
MTNQEAKAAEARMLKAINARVEEMCKNDKIQEILKGLKDDEAKKDWLLNAAIATLYGLPNA